MSRLENHNKKVARKRLFTMLVLIGVVVIFFLNSGIALLIDGSVAISRMFGGNRNAKTTDAAPEFGVVEIDDIPTATNSAAIIVSGRAHNMDTVYAYVNGDKQDEIIVEKDGSFTTEIGSLTPGDNEVYVAGTTNNRKEKKETSLYIVTFANDKPTVEISEPSDGLRTPRNEIKVTGTVKSGSGTIVRVNGSPAVVGQGGAFSAFVKLNEGENTISVTVSDDAGNSDEKTIKVIYEK